MPNGSIENNDAGLPGGKMYTIDQPGGITKLQGSEMSKINSPTSEAHLPGSEMPNTSKFEVGDSKDSIQEIIDGPKLMATLPENPEPDAAMEAMLAQLFGGARRGEKMSLVLTESNQTSRFLEGMRRLCDHDDNPDIAESLKDRWTETTVESSFVERVANFNTPIKKLQVLGIIENYDPTTGYADLTHSDFSGYAIRVDSGTNGEDKKYYFGKNENGKTADQERKEKARGFEIAYREFSIRKIIGEHVGISAGGMRDSLEIMTETAHTRASKLTITQLQEMWNLPSIENVDRDINDHTFGDQIEEAMFCYEIMLHSATKTMMQEFLDRPGVKDLVTRLAVKANMSEGEWKLENIGDVGEWADDANRTLLTYVQEVADGYRKDLTKNSNMASFEAPNGEKLTYDNETAFINKVGDLVGSVEASWFGGSTLRAFGEFSSKGFVLLPNGDFSLALGEGQFISSDDLGKFHIFLYQLKEFVKKRPSGPKDLIGKIPDLAMSFLDSAQVVVPGINGRRSIIDAWLGTSEGIKIDIDTGLPSTDTNIDPATRLPINKISEEPGHRLGSLLFGTLQRGAHGNHLLMNWLKGRDEWGIVNQIMKNDFRPEDVSMTNQKKLVKYLGIVFHPGTLSHGSPHKYVMSKAKGVPISIFKRIHQARQRTQSYVTNILGNATQLFNPTGKNGPNDAYSTALIADDNAKLLIKNEPNIDMPDRTYIDDDETLKKGLDKKNNNIQQAGRIYTENIEPEVVNHKP